MSLVKNIAVFRNWPLFYAARYGWVNRPFEMVHRNGLRLIARPRTDDLKIVKSNWVTRHYFRDFVPLTQGSVVIDVGAHIGAFSVMAALTASRVLSFEPEPESFQMLKKNVEINGLKNVSVFNLAVAAESGQRALHVYKDGSTGTHSLYGSGKTAGEAVQKPVQAISLAEIIETEGLVRVDFLKMDCEGAEHDIVMKMKPDTAEKIMHIAMETHEVESGARAELPVRLQVLGFEIRTEENGGYVYGRRVEGA